MDPFNPAGNPFTNDPFATNSNDPFKDDPDFDDPFDTKNPFQSDSVNDLEKDMDQKIHLRVTKRTTRKSVTTIEGLHHYPAIKPKKLMGGLRKKLCCNGHLTKGEHGNKVIQFQGDHRDTIRNMLIEEHKIKPRNIVKHGF